MKNLQRLCTLAALGLVLAGCQATPTSPVTVVPSVAVVNTTTSTPQPSQTPAATPTTKPTLKPTSNATATPAATRTPMPTREPTATLAPEQLAEFATLEALVTAKPELDKYYSRECILQIGCYGFELGLSPNGQWAVFFSTAQTPGLSFVNVTSLTQWNVYMDEIPNLPLDTEVLQPVHWLRDGRYVYITPLAGGDGGYGYFWRTTKNLIRLDLENGTWVETQAGAAFAFSPNDKYLAYRSGQDLVVHEFQTGLFHKFAVPSEYQAFGRVVWSPDSRQLLFIGSINDLDQEEEPEGFTLFLLTVAEMQAQVILEKDERYLYPLTWSADEGIVLRSLPGLAETDGGGDYLLDLETNEVTLKPAP